MSETIITVDQVGKKFSKNLKKSMLYGMADILKTSAGMHVQSDALRDEEFWAVEDVSFELKRGETLGVLGPNGSGKTTLLKMLNGIFMPDRGKIEVRGKTGALIQVGAGFHPMLTGRENIYINGVILGMSRAEIDRKFDAIVDFADIGDFLDSPVRNYSSGMYVRLGFAIAVYGDPDVLLIDEVLAVGDMAFRRKAAQRMMEIKENGTAIVFVTHDINRTQEFCDTGLVLKHGQVVSYGKIDEAIASYQNISYDPTVLSEKDPGFQSLLVKEKGIAETYTSNELDILDCKLVNARGKQCETFSSMEEMKIIIEVEPKKEIKDAILLVSVHRSDGIRCFIENSLHHDFKLPVLSKKETIEVSISPLQLAAGAYVLSLAISDPNILHPYGRRGGVDVFRIGSVVPNPEYKTAVYRQTMKFKV